MTAGPARPPLLVRLTPPPIRAVVGWVWWAPLPLRIAFGLIAATGLTAGGVYVWQHKAMVDRNKAVMAGWERFNTARRGSDEAGMRQALADILAADPTEGQALRWRTTLDTGAAGPTDVEQIGYALWSHLKAGRTAEAEREADKLLAKQPAHWFARCVRATARLTAGDRAGAEKELDALPAPDAPGAATDPPGLLMAFRLFKAVGRDTTVLRTFAQARLVPAYKTPFVAALPPADKLPLIDVYLESFDPAPDRPQPAHIVQGWAGVDGLADAVVDAGVKAGDTALLTRAARQSVRLAAALQRLRAADQITADQATDLANDLEGRTRRAWQAVLAADPKAAEAYTGLALSYARGSDGATARDWVVKGMQATDGADPELAQLFARLLALEGRPLAAWNQMVKTAEANPGQPVWWALAAEAALAAGRRDLALTACEKLRKASPADPWGVRTEARLWLETDQPAKAVAVLDTLSAGDLLADPVAVRLYARAVAEVGPEGKPAEFADRAAATGDPGIAAAALRGWLDAPPTAARAEVVAARAGALVSRWPTAPGLLRLAAVARYTAAERADPPWPEEKVRAARQALTAAREAAQDDSELLVALGWVRLLGERNPEQAVRELAPLTADGPARSVAELEVVGAAYLGVGRTADAVKVLERAAASREATTGCFIYLALARQAAGDPAAARAALAVARGRPRTPREQVAYRQAVAAILQ
jgi:predicted Zn-dependent protease